MIRNPRAEIEVLTWWLVERFPDDEELAGLLQSRIPGSDLRRRQAAA
jgi:hypothetical protein